MYLLCGIFGCSGEMGEGQGAGGSGAVACACICMSWREHTHTPCPEGTGESFALLGHPVHLAALRHL